MSDLVKNPFAAFEDRADPEVPTATLQIYEGIAQLLARQESTHVNRASSATMCWKRRWYQRRGEKGQPLTPRKMVNFALGDLSEKVMQYFIKQSCVGPGKLYSEVDFGKVVGSFTIQGKTMEVYVQDDQTCELGGITITGHVDGYGKRNSDGQWELIECKSSANWGFDEFKEKGPKDYIKQAHVCMELNVSKERSVRSVRYFYLRKETGHLWDALIPFDQRILDEVTEDYLAAMADEERQAPHRPAPEMKGRNPYKKPTGRTVATFPCSYCPYIEKCLGKHSVEFTAGQDGNLRPTYVFTDATKNEDKTDVS